MEIAALVSGGVDSSVVVHRLKEMGYDPTIFYIKIGMEDEEGYIDCPSEEDIEIVTFIAKKYGCRFEIVSLHEEYWNSVVHYTIESQAWFDPNPDMMCKLSSLAPSSRGSPVRQDATGHYATTTQSEGLAMALHRKGSCKGSDLFPWAGYVQVSKLMSDWGPVEIEVREIAAENRSRRPSGNSQGIVSWGKSITNCS